MMQTDKNAWILIVMIVFIAAIVMIRISNGIIDNIGWRIISLFVGFIILLLLYRDFMP